MSSKAYPRKPSRYLGISAMAVGAVFLFDPYIGILDILPDAIGYLLIAVGLYRLSDMNDRLAEASRAAGKLSLFGVARLVAILVTYALVSPTERPVFTLLMAFTLGVLDLLMLIPLWRHVAGGLLYLGSRTEATALFDRKLRGGRLHERNLCERYVSFTVFYFILREALAVLPEMTVLTHEQGGSDWSTDSLYNYVGLFRMGGIALSLLLGIVWLAMTLRFVRKLKSDKPFFNSLHRKYETEVLSNPDRFAMRAVKASLVSLAAAAVLSVDIYVEGVSILPDPLAAVLLILSIAFLGRYGRGKHRPALLSAILYTVSATAAWGMQLTYLSFNDLPYIQTEPALQAKMPTVTAVQAVSSALFLLTFLLILRCLYGLVRRHTGLRALREGSAYAGERTEAIHSRIRRKLVWVAVFAGLSALSAVLQWGAVPYLEPIDLPLRPTTGEALGVMLYDLLREAYWSVDMLLGGALVAMTVHTSLEIFEQMDYTDLMK